MRALPVLLLFLSACADDSSVVEGTLFTVPEFDVVITPFGNGLSLGVGEISDETADIYVFDGPQVLHQEHCPVGHEFVMVTQGTNLRVEVDGYELDSDGGHVALLWAVPTL